MLFKCSTITQRGGKTVNAQLVEAVPKGEAMRIDLSNVSSALAAILNPEAMYEIAISKVK